MCRVLSSTIDSLIYTPDPNGNRSTLTRAAIPAPTPAMANTTYNAANQLLAYNGKTLSYDANGNLQNRIDSCGTTIYDWDGRNRLTGISGFKPDCTTLTAGFSYDGLNRRTSKTINGTTTQFIYDGIDIIQEVTSGIKTNYVRTLNVDEPLTRITNGDIRHYLRDGLGSIIGLTDDTGSAVATFSYDAFGNTASAESFGYTGRENDGTGLLYYRARYYSPEIGRFISEDPIRLRGGINYFGYVQNNPVNFIDPTGLFWFRQDWQTPGVVGRPGTPVPPGGAVSEFMERKLPAGYTFGEMHDAFVDAATSVGIPDAVANIPSMIPMYAVAIGTEVLRTLGILNQPTPAAQPTTTRQPAPCK